MPKRISIENKESDAASGSRTVTSPVRRPEAKVTSPVSIPVELPRDNQKTDSFSHVHDSAMDTELLQRSGTSSLSAFCAYPPGMNFAGREVDEEVVLLLRAHVITNVPWIVVMIIALLLPLIIGPLLISFNVLPSLALGTGIVLSLFWYLGVFTYAFLNFLYWFFNVYIVTNERLVDVDWYSVVNRDMKFADLTSIQDVTAGQFGVLAGIFDFGDVKIETAGTEPNIIFAKVPHPQIVSKKIQELREKEQVEERGGHL